MMKTKVRIKDIAKMANVSTATVSRVINNKPEGVGIELRNQILKYIKDTGYCPNLLAKSMVTKKTYTIGLLSPDISAPFFQYLIKGINDYLQAHDYTMILCNSDFNASGYHKYIETLLGKGIDGIILIGFFGETSQTLMDLLSGTPIVLFDYVPNLEQVVQINTNNRQSAYELTRYLTDMGHERIGCIIGPEQFDTVRERLKGYQRALREKGIPYDSSIILRGDFSTDSAMEPAGRLLRQSDVTAIFCFNDLMAYGVYKLCTQLKKRIPDDISVVGFDDIPYSELLNPPLTTVYQPGYRLGAEGAKMLLSQINGTEEKKIKKVLKNSLIIRSSVKNRKAGKYE
ncbi:MAG: LacI family transcriptional regulator [Hungatella sp.]|jgi:LacI family transcriptional regulator|nr:LacI family transcriptional regulator [Hungatella sp.]